ncbi:PepSY-associated TM helix domain-containing protein [Rhodococcus sp. IEGM 1401]|uniref:PepSY-associated TM helix domain-containing protein n=1 Tax=Rhodococcus sp. IEGM 1372 TaxID=3047087 RepID=UPI0002ACCEA1|nr:MULTISPECIES: PepSY-associated TM helix domain-containing protein [unclassified Rhodococcus (in: high G+C Gram-positive bacteria)]MCZ4563483.1 PepSY-associated TM helix domain-containing protein [Rhodococcus sp. IEGM 1401]MDI9923606.1 PepSY-associated TM helix domain-containing protein [Rhodococcus sp. IEGM 1372]MDV8036099.1 PepSY-associated TM helix domain-containing protein [Rhodococcus sp. IEGM 1414]CCQ18212.1 putative integral membrane protein [Rhodococcus sp. AW25M09]
MLAVDDVPEGYGRTVFVDPYTAQVRGELTTFGEWLPVRAWIDELHRNLHLGDLGRNYSELAASWLWVVALGGLVLWTPGSANARPVPPKPPELLWCRSRGRGAAPARCRGTARSGCGSSPLSCLSRSPV